jgi:16S rRNA (adenine1518-N6/adenine1519-N6)-dimethyltransferase
VPGKRLGQHFLTDPRILGRIVDFAAPAPDDTVLEIGPGTGSLTRVLATRVARVIAVEVDAGLIPALRRELPVNVELIASDALAVDLGSISDHRYAVIANLPYNISTVLLERFVKAREIISRVTVLVQKEVADRILAPPGTRTYGPLSVGIQHYATPKGGILVPPGAFRPPPRVFSRVVRLDWRPEAEDVAGFRGFVSGAFAARRKKLLNNLTAMFPGRTRPELEAVLASLGLSTDLRPEKLSPSQLLSLWKALDPRAGPPTRDPGSPSGSV